MHSRITGVGDEPQSISFVPQDEDLPGSTLPIAANVEDTDEETAITTVCVHPGDVTWCLRD
jgi:hypothetical protein